MTVETQQTFDREYITNYSKKRNEPKWFLDLRIRGLDLSEDLPLPKLEKTNMTKWNVNQFKHDVQEKSVEHIDELPADMKNIFVDEQQAANIVIHKNGSLIYKHTSEELHKKGVIYTDFQTAINEHSDLLSNYVMKRLFAVDEHKLTALHAALINCGVFLYVPKNTEVEVPVQSLFWNADQEVGIVPHVLIIAEENSKVTYIENTFGAESLETVNNSMAEVYVGNGAHVTFAAIDNLSEETTNYVYRRGEVERDGRIDWALGQMHSGHAISENTTILKGDGSTGDTKSVVVGKGSQSLNFVQKMVQQGLSTQAHMMSHGVMKDSARAIFNGISKIDKGSTKSNSQQTERILMMSEKARGDANPILLIDEDDVTAGHAASVGQVDAKQLYYLMSRGIPRNEAERLIILGFLNPVVDKIPLEGMKKRLIDVIERKVRL